jgi:(4-O-methyl)-D-glucuronate---lignin esterase
MCNSSFFKPRFGIHSLAAVAYLLLAAAVANCAQDVLPMNQPGQDGIELEGGLKEMRHSFRDPPMNCRPHTRWWWMGNALSKKDITWQLEQMHAQGIGGVEQISMEPVYERGNHPYLSDAYFDLVRHAIREAKKLHMEVSLNFGGPGWVWGGDWLPADDRCQILMASSVDLEGPQTFDGNLPTKARLNPHDPRNRPNIEPDDRLVSVVAGKVVDDVLVESSLTNLTGRAQGRRLEWQVPSGKWRLMAFWLTYDSPHPVLDLLSKPAMEHYCDYLGGKFRAAFGKEFGKTVESFFGDSFEVPIFRNGIYWNGSLLGEFRKRKGYDLVRYLPALWWKVGEISPKIRYDVNEFLSQVGMESFFDTFVGWCERNHVRARVQPYGFVTDILEGAGKCDIPELEITAGEKDAVPWFDTRIGPREYTASGAHIYGRNVVSAEAYTYLHWQQGRDTLEELKIAGDMFLRAGANKFYNQGFTGTPEREFVPSRRFTAEMLISPVNVWWRYYHLLSDYVARCCALLRYGRPVADIAVYSPLANQWTLDVLNARRWTRDFDWGDLGKLILANGYDFDLINDDVLQHHASFSHGDIQVRDLTYRILVLPNIHALPLETMKRVEEYAKGGGVVIALEQIPGASTGLADYREHDKDVRAIASEMFRTPVGRNGTGEHQFGNGQTYFLKDVMYRTDQLDWRSSVFDPFVNTLRRHVTPDFGIDFVREAIRENRGLVFKHRTTRDADIYFVANVQDRPVDSRISFRVSGRSPQEWNPYSGEIKPLYEYEPRGDTTIVPVRLAPFESTIFIFGPGGKQPHVLASDFAKIVRMNENSLEAFASKNGVHEVTLPGGGNQSANVEGIPAPFEIAGNWQLVLESKGFPRTVQVLPRLHSWTVDPTTKHFSGTGRYTIAFDLPVNYVAKDLDLELRLGDVGNVADVQLNGYRVGVIWLRGQALDVTKAVKAGRNILEVDVTNTLINRVAGWKTVPELPDDLKRIYGRGIDDNSPRALYLSGFKPLPRSGLLGPVTIQALKQVRVDWSARPQESHE